MTQARRILGPACLAIAGVAVMLALLPIGQNTFDLTRFLIPWMDAVRAGGLSSISGEFSNYTPPYIYLMALFSGLVPLVGAIAAIKLISVPFVAATALGIAAIVQRATGNRGRAMLAGAVVCVAPTILVNAFAWGQADVIYTSFLALFVLCAMHEKPMLAAVMFGLALSFKLQAMFLAPLLLYLLLSRQMRVAHLLLIPLTFALMMVPAALAGRPWPELLTIYYGQSQYFRELSNLAPNPWRFVQRLDLLSYETGTILGLIAGAAAGLAISMGALRLARSARTTLLVGTLCAAVMPYVLPKMHDRYFFVADVLTIALAFVMPRSWPAAVLFQLGSLTAYLAYFGLSHRGPTYAFVPITLGVLILLLAVVDAAKARPSGQPEPSLRGA